MWKNEKDSEGRPNRIFLVTYGEAETRAAMFPAELPGIKKVLGQMFSDLIEIDKNGVVEFREGLVDFFGRVTAYKYNLLRVSNPESLPGLFTYYADSNALFAEGVITAAGIIERISQEETVTVEVKLWADQLRIWVMGLSKN